MEKQGTSHHPPHAAAGVAGEGLRALLPALPGEQDPSPIWGAGAARQGEGEDGCPRAAPKSGIWLLKSGKLLTVSMGWGEM